MKRKVIGWASNSDFELVEGDIDPSYFEALYNDIDEHEYFFSGDIITLCPVFDDYHILDFSSRGWAHIMANDNYDDDYLEYYVADSKEEYKLPQEGPYVQKIPIMVVTSELYQLVKENTIEFFYRPSEYTNAYVFLPLEEGDTNIYWTKLPLILKNIESGETFEIDVKTILHISGENALNELVDKYKTITPFYSNRPDNNLVIYPENLKEKLKNHPLTILVLRS